MKMQEKIHNFRFESCFEYKRSMPKLVHWKASSVQYSSRAGSSLFRSLDFEPIAATILHLIGTCQSSYLESRETPFSNRSC